MELRPIKYPQQLVHDFDEAVPPGRFHKAFMLEAELRARNLVVYGCSHPEMYDDADSIAWRAYSKAWPEAMAGMREVFIGGSSLGRREIVWSNTGIGPADDPMPRHDRNWLTGEPAASQAERDAWWARQQPKLDWSDS